MCWIWLFLAIFLEVAATVLMKLSNGLTRTVPTLGMFVLYGLSFIPMTIALKEMEIGAVYAIWSAVGTAAVALLGVIVFHEQASPLKAIAIVLIIAGVVCLNLSARHPSQSSVEAQAQLRSDLRMEPKANAGTVGAPRVASATVRPVTGP
jgi:small multidrug resistance pump